MQKPSLLKIFAVMLFLFVTTTFAANKTETQSNNKIYTQDQLNFLIEMKQPEFTIKLKSNPTTGYSWYLREYTDSLITPVKRVFEAAPAKLMGAPGYELWTFRVKPSGFTVPQQTTLRFVYSRPWQAESSTQLVFLISTMGK